MDITVGSDNPVKRCAVKRTCPDTSVTAVVVDLGASEQPASHDETIAGTATRMERALGAGDYNFGVGVRGDVVVSLVDDGMDETDLYLVMWAAVTDDKRVGHATRPSLALLARIAGRIDMGEELGLAMDDVFGADDTAKDENVTGVFTGGRLARTDALESIVTGAFTPFRCELY